MFAWNVFSVIQHVYKLCRCKAEIAVKLIRAISVTETWTIYFCYRVRTMHNHLYKTKM